MIIVSQSKTSITNFDNVNQLGIGKNGVIWITDNTIRGGTFTYNILGKYKTEERAKEVLADIYMKYSNWQSMRMMKNEEIQAKMVSRDNSDYFDVYMMPEE